MIANIHINNQPIGKPSANLTLHAFCGTDHQRNQYYGLVWATTTDDAKNVLETALHGGGSVWCKTQFLIDLETIVIWPWNPADGTPGWGVVSNDQANAMLLDEVDA